MSAKNEHGLTPQREVFAQGVASGKCPSDAYRAAFKSEKMKASTIHENASRLMSDSKVAARIAGFQAKSAEIAELDGAKIMSEIARLAHSDIAGIMTPDGKVKLPHELDAATRAAVASFEIDEYGRIKYKFWDKNAALEKAAKIKGLYELDNKQKSDPLAELLKGLAGNVLGPVKATQEPDDGGGDDIPD